MSSADQQEAEVGDASVARARRWVNEGMDKAFAVEGGLDIGTSSVKDIRDAIADCITVVATKCRQAELEASGAELALEVGEIKLTVLVLLGEDIPMSFVNIWLMTTFHNDISPMLLVSFALNCVQVGYKLPKILELLKLGARRVKAMAAAVQLKAVTATARVSIAVRRASIVGSEDKDLLIVALRAEVAAMAAEVAKHADIVAAKDAEIAAKNPSRAVA